MLDQRLLRVYSRVHVFCKELLYKEPTCRRPENLQGNCTSKDKIPMECFNFEHFYHCKQSRYRQLVPFIGIGVSKCFIEGFMWKLTKRRRIATEGVLEV